jgi:cysteinyl-tRNA synthetase
MAVTACSVSPEDFTVSPRLMGASETIDYRLEMIKFVQALAARARSKSSPFGVFVQNASELGADPHYVAALTGIGQEGLSYGYVRDARATPAKVTQELETNLDRFKAAGKLVLTIDYPFRHKSRPQFDRATRQRIDAAYRRSEAKGYIPYATVRRLNFLTVNRGHEPQPHAPAIPSWSQVREFAYQLQPAKSQNRQAFLSALADSQFDLVVMDYSFDGGQSGEFTAPEITRLKSKLGGKVIAYLSIGEAEDYRWYWQETWDADREGRPDAGAPGWLDAENPSWPGNYKVRYWKPEWQAIIFAYLDKILAQGFDGIYLDLVDAYEYYQSQ